MVRILSLRGRAGLTLLEVLLTLLLFSTVFMCITTAYLTALNFFSSLRENTGPLDSLLAHEAVVRRLALANDVTVSDGGRQVKLRWDWTWNSGTQTFTANDTPQTDTDDSWVKYRLVQNGSDYELRWRTDTTAATDVTGSDAEIYPDLLFTAASLFTLTNPSTAGDPTVVTVNFVTQVGQPPKAMQLSSDIMTGAQGKN